MANSATPFASPKHASFSFSSPTLLSICLLSLSLALLILPQCNSSAPPRHSWAGTNSFFLYALSDSDRLAHLAAMRTAGMKVVRIFIAEIGEGSKGSSAVNVPDVEPDTVGVYDDTILEKIDQLLYEAVQYGIKLDISMHDRYALGCWGKDAYWWKYRFPDGTGNGTCNAHKNDVHTFYQNATIEADFDRRLLHIIQHRNPLLNNHTWGELDNAIFTFAPQNEAQSQLDSKDWQWACRRAKIMRPYVVPGILLSTNGAGVEDSLQEALFECAELDVMAIHNYYGDQSFAANYSHTARRLAQQYNKRVVVEEFGSLGDNVTRAAGLAAQIDGIMSAHLPWMFWELVKGSEPTDDYELWTDDSAAWGLLVNWSLMAAADTEGAFVWPELFGDGNVDGETGGEDSRVG